MPGLSGLETLSRIKEIKSSIPVIMITKSEEEHIMEELKKKRIMGINKVVEEIKRDGGVDTETFWKIRKRILGKKKKKDMQ